MENLKVGDIIQFVGDELVISFHKAEVRGICGSIIFTREIYEKGVSNTAYLELDELITMGWTKLEAEIPDMPGFEGTQEALADIKV